MRPRLAWLFAFWLTTGLAPACGGGQSVPAGKSQPGCHKPVEDKLLALESPPDGAAACDPGACNYQTQAGCADDQGCRPQFNAIVAEVHPGCDAVGSGKSGDACKLQSDC